MTRVAIIQGNPDAASTHFGHALAEAYASAAREAGHEVREIRVASLDFALLKTQEEWRGAPPPAIASAQQTIAWAEHLVFVFPLWLGDMPALLKGFLEQALRPGFALGENFTRLLKSRSARLIVTMGMPGLAYRFWFRSHSMKSFERNILHFCGVSPVHMTYVGLVEQKRGRERALAKAVALGRKAA
ncbi:MAG TPA: NAD(P)H-dependent oxidoreductase [Burkholderiales bacterium]|nr:NAD(P)H-dependent oxidoreductase [Burkholderiales bacterium]